jgi:hypothetical protein
VKIWTYFTQLQKAWSILRRRPADYNKLVSDEEFIKIINESGLTPEQISYYVQIPVSGARAWLAGNRLPHRLIRSSIIKNLSEKRKKK